MLAFHPLSEALPLIEGAELAELVQSISQNGQREPITVLDNKILDGRNRYRACLEAGIEPRFEPFTGHDPVAFVADRNLNRRHLTSGQKAMAVAKLATLASCLHKPKTATGQPVALSVPEVAAMAGINKSTVSDAKTVYAHGTPEEVASVVNGHAPLTPVAKTVRARRDVPNGPPVTVPEGAVISKLAREGIELQHRGMAALTASRKIGLSWRAYALVRDVILLLERDDLDAQDAAACKAALREIDQTQRLGSASKVIAPIAKRVFGVKGYRMKNAPGSSPRHAGRNFKQFDNAVSFLQRACETAVDMRIPYISKAQADAAAKQLAEAETFLRKLRQRIKESRYD